MRKIRWWAVWGVLLSCGAAWGQVGDDRLPVPEGAKVKEALGLVREVFAEEYAAAKTGPQKAALAKKILQEGATGEHDPTSRYALLRVARDLAAIAGDAETALKAIDELARRYRVDAIAMKATVLAKLAAKLRLPADHKKFLPVLGKAYDEAVAADRYDVARAIGKLATDSAKKTRDPIAKNAVEKKLKALKQLEADYAKIKDALAVLETKPTDPEANLAVGKYRCFVRGDWDDGLPYLALGSDPVLQKLAEQEVVMPDSATDQAKLADGWWDLAEKEKDAATKKRMQQRAGFWYKKALPKLTGLGKKKVEKRLADIEKETSPKKIYLAKLEPTKIIAFSDIREVRSVGGVKIRAGFFCHPPQPNSSSHVTFGLNGDFRLLSGAAGICDGLDTGRSSTALRFRIVGDGRLLWQSRALQTQGDAQSFRVNVSRVKKLELFVDCPGFHGNAGAVWMDPILTR